MITNTSMPLQDPFALMQQHMGKKVKYLSEAVLIVPCGHSLRESYAQQICGTAQPFIPSEGILFKGGIRAQPGINYKALCSSPGCNSNILWYIPNQTLRNIAMGDNTTREMVIAGLFHEAVTFVPCGHSFASSMALMSIIRDHTGNHCIICCQNVSACVPNFTLRAISDFFSDLRHRNALSMLQYTTQPTVRELAAPSVSSSRKQCMSTASTAPHTNVLQEDTEGNKETLKTTVDL